MDFISEIFTWFNLLSRVTDVESRDETRLPQTNIHTLAYIFTRI